MVKCAAAAFMAAYTGSPGNPRMPSTEWTLTIEPPPPSIIAGSMARVTSSMWCRFTSYIACQDSGDDRWKRTSGR